VLAAAADQWPLDVPGPSFSHIVDLHRIDDMLPAAWRAS
jgi:hypothetical protein